ncbi:tyrosine-type recombinase/integrase [Winogradskyella sp. ECml5-4]|uniref:tyrosine-type recombinase/integrase n=1 Tax=Winogradskyella sp. ECml5-4 TaxID=3110975 RepID=UPI002FF311C9
MASTKYYIQSKKQSAPIYLRFSDSTKFNIKRKTGLFINPSSWSTATNYPIAKDETTKSIKSKLLKLESFVIDNYNEANSTGKNIDGKWLENIIDKFFNRANLSNPFETIFGTIDYIIENAHIRKNGKGSIGLSYNRIKGYKNLKVVLAKYNNEKDIFIKSIDRVFINDFANWLLKDEAYKVSTANKKISDLKGVCFEAESHGIAINTQLRHIKNLTENRKETVIVLNRKELDKIERTKIENKSLANVKKWLLFGCEIGQRLDDLLNITEQNITTSKNGKFRVVKLTQQKGNKKVEIPLNPTAERIIKDGLPYKISKANFNLYVKKLCKKCKIKEEIEHWAMDPETNRKKFKVYKKHQLITGHTCRRSFASNYYGQMANSLIMQVTGHTTEKTFLKYIGKSNEDFTSLIYSEMLNSFK